MLLADIKKNLYREDIMIAAVKHELSESHVYAILNGTRSLLEDHQPIIETLKALS